MTRTGQHIMHTPNERADLWRWVKDGAADECWPWTHSVDGSGYGQFYAEARKFKAHRLAYELAVGPIPSGMEVCHSCDNPPCCNPAHLFLGTHKDNMNDRDRKGRIGRRERGEAHVAAKLTEAAVREIRLRYAAGESSYRLSPEYGVSDATVLAVVQRRTWRHVT